MLLPEGMTKNHHRLRIGSLIIFFGDRTPKDGIHTEQREEIAGNKLT